MMLSYKALALVSHAIFVLAMCVHASVAASSSYIHTCSPNPTKTIVVYIQDVAYTGTNSNYTSYPVAGIQGTTFSNEQFGTIFVYDEPVTISASSTSTLIGCFRGFYTVVSLGGGAIFITGTIQFTGGQYANSTLNIKGLGQSLVNVPAQLGIDGGTKVFNDAVGNATLEAILQELPNTVIKATITYKTAI